MTILFNTNLLQANYILAIISFLAIGFAIYIIISKNPILSVLFLIALFICISIYLIYIGLTFLGLVYLIVYVGAVSILFLFILMLINVRVSELLSDSRNSISLAILATLCFNYFVNNILPYNVYIDNRFYNIKLFNSISMTETLGGTFDISEFDNHYLSNGVISVTAKIWDSIVITTSHMTSIGNILYTNLFVPFIITSLILLLAMVGAIIITINKSKIQNNLNNTPKSKGFINVSLK